MSLILSLALFAGCACQSGRCCRQCKSSCSLRQTQAPSNEALIGKVAEEMKTSLMAKDVERVMALFSDNFSTTTMPDKDSAQALIEYGLSMGFFDTCEISYDLADLTLEGDKAQLYPFRLQSGSDLITAHVEMSKELAGWKITGLSVEGI